MKVVNVHERELPVACLEAGALIDSLASVNDALWPRQTWPPMEFDRPLSVGATGGHGPIRYFVESYSPGESIRFRFTGPKGFNGCHRYDVVSSGQRACILRHTLEMTAHGPAVLSWPLLFRPMHDALIEDSLAVAEAALRRPAHIHPWSVRVRFLRWVFSRGRARPQIGLA